MHTLGWRLHVGWLLLLGGLAGPVWSQETPAVRFFDCGVQFFGATCGPAPDIATPGSAPAVVSPPRPPAPPAPPVNPLFTPETVAPDTPPVVLRLLQEPTAANARAFLDWQRARLARILAVQALLQQLEQAEETARQVGWPATDGAGFPGPAHPAAVCPVTPGSAGRRACVLP